VHGGASASHLKISPLMINFGSWLHTLMSQPELPAWLQAIAAFVALFISVWASWRIGSIERRRDRLQARGIAVAIYPEIESLTVTVKDARTGLLKIKEQAGTLAGQAVGASIQLTAQIKIPPLLDRNVERLFLLGEPAGPACLQLVSMMLQYNARVEAVVARTLHFGPGHWADGISQLEEHLTQLDEIVTKCTHEVEPMHNSVRR
jgi:hypothetical protein